MSGGKINADLQKERAKCSFDPKELTHFLDGSAIKTEERKSRGEIDNVKIPGMKCSKWLFLLPEKFFLEDAELKSKVPMEYLSHKEKYEENIRKACVIFRKVQELQNAGKAGMENYRWVEK